MFHCLGCAIRKTAFAAAGTNYEITPLLDGYLRTERNQFQVPRQMWLYGGWLRTDITSLMPNHPRIVSRAFDNTGPAYLTNNVVAIPGSPVLDIVVPPPAMMRRLETPHNYSVVATQMQNSGATASIQSAVLLGDRDLSFPAGEVWTAHFSFLWSGPMNQWNTSSLTLNDPLPPGTYAVIGATCGPDFNSDCPGFFRIRFQNQEWRPGGSTTEFSRNPQVNSFRYGRMGLWGTFTESSLPLVEHLDVVSISSGTPENFALYLDIVKIS